MEQGWHRISVLPSLLWAGPLLTAKHQGRHERLQGGGPLPGTNTDFMLVPWCLAKLLAPIWTYTNFYKMNKDIRGKGI